MSDEKITRRDFVRTTAGLTAGAAVGALAAAGAKPDTSKTLNFNPKMGYRRFGRTGVMLSEIGLGGHLAKFKGDSPPPDVQVKRNEVWVKCAELGINFVDITMAREVAIYARCMKMTGVRLHIGYSDHDLCIRKPENRTPERMMLEIDEGLRRLMVDRMFLWRPLAMTKGGHTDAELEAVIATFEKARQQGKVRFLGMSAHDRTWVRQVLEKYGDHFHGFVFMLGVGDVPKRDCEALFEITRKKDIGTVGLKPFHGNSYFAKAIKEARKEGREPDLNAVALAGLKKILEFPHLTCTIPGMNTVGEVENNVRASYERHKKLTRGERQAVQRLADASLLDLPPDYAWIREQAFA